MIFGTVICLFAKRWPKFWTFALCAAIPLAAGGLSALLTRGSMDDFAALNQPKDLRNVKENARRKRGDIKLQET